MKEEKKESPIGVLWGWGKPYHGKFIGSIILAGRPGGSISDPWYTGDFTSTFADVKAGCEGLLEYIFARAE